MWQGCLDQNVSDPLPSPDWNGIVTRSVRRKPGQAMAFHPGPTGRRRNLSLGSLGQFRRPWAGLRGTGPALAGKLGQGTAFALRAREGVDRFQCSLRSDPATAGVSKSNGPPINRLPNHASQPAEITGMDREITPIGFPKIDIRSPHPFPPRSMVGSEHERVDR